MGPVYQYSHAGGACAPLPRIPPFRARVGLRYHFTIPGRLSSFGENARGELFMVSHSGTVYRLAG